MRGILIVSCFFILFVSNSLGQSIEEKEISLRDAQQFVLLNNFEVASSRLGVESARRLFAGEKGVLWEPVLVAGVDRVSNERENNTEEFIRQGVEDFSEDNTLYNLGLEQPLPTGGSLQLSYNVDNLENNLQEQRELDFEEKEFDSFAGVTLVQPLLRNGGTHIGLSLLRMAREESEIAFQEYRRQMMRSLGQVEAGYWELHIAQQRVKLRQKSVEVAEKILEDNRARVENGKMSELEVQEAEAGLATRRSQLLEAEQILKEASTQLLGFFALPEVDPSLQLRAVDEPDLSQPPELNATDLKATALEYHPDILIRQHRFAQDELRAQYAKNQVLPQVDLRASYGYNGLGESSSRAFDAVQEGDFPSWTVGVQLSVPLGGGQRQRAEKAAALNRVAQAELGIRAVRQQIIQGLNTSISRVMNYYQQAKNFEEVSNMNQVILDTELALLDAGRSDSRKVLDAEEKVTQAREAVAASLTRLAVAKVEMELSSGSLLMNLGVDPMNSDVDIEPLVLEDLPPESEEDPS